MDIKKLYSLKLVGFSEKEADSFSSVLFLAEKRLQHIWKIVETDLADFYLLPNKEILELFDGGWPRERCIFYAPEPSQNGTLEIRVDQNNVPNLRSVVDVFNRLTEQTHAQAVESSSAHTVPEVDIIVPGQSESPEAVSDFFNQGQGILKYLLPVKAPMLNFRFHLPDGISNVYVDSEQQLFFCTGGVAALGGFFADENLFSVASITAAQLSNAVNEQALFSRPLSSLIWYVVFKLSQGRLLEGHSAEDLVYLTRWPDLGIPECRKYVKLVAFLRGNAASLQAASAATSTPMGQVIDFYNACFLTGLIQKPQSPEHVKEHIDGDKQLVLESINKQLIKLKLADGP